MSLAEKEEFPRPRSGAVIFVYDNHLMVWGGMTQVFFGEGDGRFLVSFDLPEEENPTLEVMDLSTYEWRRVKTYGDIPSMGKSSFHIVREDTLYLYGGNSSEYCNGLYKLDLNTFHWQELKPNKSSSLPPKMCEGGSVLHGTSMFVYGGKGRPLQWTESIFGATFKPNLSFGYLFDDGWHNALYEYSIIENRWAEVGSKNDGRPPPCSRFSFNKIDLQRALLFGGKQDKYKVTYGDVYILDLETKQWEKHSPSPDQKWPSARGFHVANCLVDPDSDESKTEQRVIVFWGQGSDAKHVPDIWVLHVESMKWKELKVPPSYNLKPRMFFSSWSNHLQAKQTDVIVYGGNKQRRDKFDRNVMTNPVIFRFGSVQRLDRLCINTIQKCFESLDTILDLLPLKLQNELIETNNEHDSSHPVVIYPLESNFVEYQC